MQYTLKELRARKNLTQQEMAEILKISTQTWNSWEQNPKIIKLGAAEEISKFFGVKVSDIKL